MEASASILDLASEAFALDSPTADRLEYFVNETLSRHAQGASMLRVVCNEMHGDESEFKPILRRDFHANQASADTATPFYSHGMLQAHDVLAMPINQRLRAQPGQAVESYAGDLLGEEALLASSLYRDCFQPSGFQDAWMSVRVIDADYSFGLIAPQRTGAARLSNSEINTLSTLGRITGALWMDVAQRPVKTADHLLEAHGLPETQVKVLKFALTGLSEKWIARRIDRSPHTVHNHLRELYRRFNVSSRAELIALSLGRFKTPSVNPKQT
ncbi:Bacterial regulatory protein, luxR family [Pseudobythopirellula maris]|uniref:Bacterial regulatory protein, luxR family n=1 Tax=Pseudobythopirellula maris TaxID=2527991 RepID=A0A5C5ZLE5_9BACT|nr:helix-turn-helix transcriptional regulator [Pseudobythopirellula maris]TWT88262.1 Bacterial regulatory protein, luxR family [Pseudobythopirellula maris]